MITPSPFIHNYGKSPLAPLKVVTQSAAKRTAETIKFSGNQITIPTQVESDHSTAIRGRRIGV